MNSNHLEEKDEYVDFELNEDEKNNNEAHADNFKQG